MEVLWGEQRRQNHERQPDDHREREHAHVELEHQPEHAAPRHPHINHADVLKLYVGDSRLARSSGSRRAWRRNGFRRFGSRSHEVEFWWCAWRSAARDDLGYHRVVLFLYRGKHLRRWRNRDGRRSHRGRSARYGWNARRRTRYRRHHRLHARQWRRYEFRHHHHGRSTLGAWQCLTRVRVGSLDRRTAVTALKLNRHDYIQRIRGEPGAPRIREAATGRKQLRVRAGNPDCSLNAQPLPLSLTRPPVSNFHPPGVAVKHTGQ
jgi:hypothetical protein